MRVFSFLSSDKESEDPEESYDLRRNPKIEKNVRREQSHKTIFTWNTKVEDRTVTEVCFPDSGKSKPAHTLI